MLVAGQVLEAEVTQVRSWGVYCNCEGQEAQIRIPETSWIACFASLDQFADVGDRLTVRIVYVHPETGEASASVRQVHSNPWEDGRLDVGLEYAARVVRHVSRADRCADGRGCLLELLPGAHVMLCDRHQRLNKNDAVRVIIRTSDASRRSVTVALCEP